MARRMMSPRHLDIWGRTPVIEVVSHQIPAPHSCRDGRPSALEGLVLSQLSSKAQTQSTQ